MIFSDEAAADLDEIWTYSFTVWGETQAGSYSDALRAATERLLDRQRRYDARPAQLGLLRIRAGSHFIYFRDDGEAVVIVRILHVAMDAPRHLS